VRRKLIQAILAKLKLELGAVLAAAKSAHEAATHAESKAEDQYDTRGLEASYLAEAQAKRAAELERLVRMYEALLATTDHPPAEAIGPGSLVELELAGKRLLSLFSGDRGWRDLGLARRPAGAGRDAPGALGRRAPGPPPRRDDRGGSPGRGAGV
jgi:hypothetical protein